MTTLYFVRHAESNLNDHDDRNRGLTEKGRKDSQRITQFFADKTVDAIFSSPYKRAVDTVRDLAGAKGLPIHLEDGFRERRVDSAWIEDFSSFTKAQWADFDYKLSDGESLREVQERNIAAVNCLVSARKNRTIVVGSHGTALSTIIHFYDPTFGYADFEKMKGLMPWIVQFSFADDGCVKIQAYNVLDV